MGIPRFYRWLSERYPLINENIAAERIPEFDNLYLDMNGIIHNCSHNNKGGLCVADEDEVYALAFDYVSRLFSIIRPKKLFYMAVDGCAPRAKMNQQRSRRFRAANEAREARERAEEVGEVLEGPQFDSNCITPGTEFMAKLTEQLRYFVCQKIQADPLWQDVIVVLSGPDEPGEGEHKIMDYIRSAKAQPGYAANLRHCLYGLDADLIMLALASHEPHFALLREEVVFGKPKAPTVAELTQEKRFQLLHISLLREYLELEFRPPPASKQQLPFPFNLERLIDDFILFCVLVGNDFLPCLPFADISEGGLDDFFEVYKEHLKRATQGQPPWLTHDCGRVEYGQLALFLKRYAALEDSRLEASVDEGTFVLGRRRVMGALTASDVQGGETLQDPPATPDHAKTQYYKMKFGLNVDTHKGTQERRKLFQSYVEGLQWVLLYYYRGPNCASWSWFYPYYHAPLAADLTEYDRLARPEIDFTSKVGEPFLPFQQLMAVLPADSKTLLPKCFQYLFDTPASPIVDFYPPRFEIDMDWVKVPWGGVTLIPFIDQDRLLAAMAEAERRGPPLSLTEEARNRIGEAWSFRYDPTLCIEVKSPVPHKMPHLPQCPVRSSVFKHPPLPAGMSHFINDVLPGFQRNMRGFPTLHVHPISITFESGVQVFQFLAKGRSLILHLQPTGPIVQPEEEFHRLLQAPWVRTDFPFGRAGKVKAVHTVERVFYPGGKVGPNPHAKDHESYVRQQLQDWRKRGVALYFDSPGRGRGHSGGYGDSWPLAIAEVLPAEGYEDDGQGGRQLVFSSTSQYRLVHLCRIEEAPPVQKSAKGAAAVSLSTNGTAAPSRGSQVAPPPPPVPSPPPAPAVAAASSSASAPTSASSAHAASKPLRAAAGSAEARSFYAGSAAADGPTPGGARRDGGGGGGARPAAGRPQQAAAAFAAAPGGGGGCGPGAARTAAAPRGPVVCAAEPVDAVDWDKAFRDLLALGPRPQGAAAAS